MNKIYQRELANLFLDGVPIQIIDEKGVSRNLTAIDGPFGIFVTDETDLDFGYVADYCILIINGEHYFFALPND